MPDLFKCLKLPPVHFPLDLLSPRYKWPVWEMLENADRPEHWVNVNPFWNTHTVSSFCPRCSQSSCRCGTRRWWGTANRPLCIWAPPPSPRSRPDHTGVWWSQAWWNAPPRSLGPLAPRGWTASSRVLPWDKKSKKLNKLVPGIQRSWGPTPEEWLALTFETRWQAVVLVCKVQRSSLTRRDCSQRWRCRNPHRRWPRERWWASGDRPPEEYVRPHFLWADGLKEKKEACNQTVAFQTEAEKWTEKGQENRGMDTKLSVSKSWKQQVM